MLDAQKVMTFVATRDGRRARDFYEGTLGLQVISDDDYALALDAHGTQIRIQKVELSRLIPSRLSGGWYRALTTQSRHCVHAA